jgi:anti-sigma regulatory factor (Ser/Thr protein kinase)
MTEHATVQMPQPAVEVRLDSQPIYLAGARELIIALARRIGFRDEASGQIALAVDEALANVINHGYQRRPDGRIWIKLWPCAAQSVPGICIVIEDEARQVEPETICGRSLEDIKPGGLGVHIIRQVMDQVTYEKRSPAGMRLTMVKPLDPHTPNTPHTPDTASRCHG